MDPVPAFPQQKTSMWVPVQVIVKPRPIDLAPDSSAPQTHAWASLTG